MADSVVQFVIKATNEATPEFQRTADSVQKLGANLRVFGTASHEAQISTARMLDSLKSTDATAKGATGDLQQFVHLGLESMGEVAPGVTSALGRLTASISGVQAAAVAFSAAGIGAASLVKGFTDANERMENLSHQTGLSIDALEALQQVARESGESFDAIGVQMGKVNMLIADLSKGNIDSVEKQFAALGISFKALVDSGKTTEQILEVIAQRISAIEDPTKRAAAQADIFGSRSLAMSNILKQVGEEGLQTVIDKMREAGVVTDEATRQVARSLDHMQDLLDRRLQGTRTQLAGGLSVMTLELVAGVGRSIDALKSLVLTGLSPESISKVFAVFSGLGSEIQKALDDVTKNVAASFRQLQLESDKTAAALEPVGIAATTAAKPLADLAGVAQGVAGALDLLGAGLKDVADAAKAAAQIEGFQKTLEGLERLLNEGKITTEQYDRAMAAVTATIERLTSTHQPLVTEMSKVTKATDQVTTSIQLLQRAWKEDVPLGILSTHPSPEVRLIETNAAIRGLLDGVLGATRGFDDMGREVTALMRDMNGVTQEFILNEARLTSWTQSAELAAQAADTLGNSARNMATQLGTVPNPSQIASGWAAALGLPDKGSPWTAEQVFAFLFPRGGPTFQHGGVVGGMSSEPVPIIAHGGEAVGAPDVLVSAFFQAMARLKTTGEPMADRGLQRIAGVQIVIQQAPNQKPEDLAKTLVPALRRELARGTL